MLRYRITEIFNTDTKVLKRQTANNKTEKEHRELAAGSQPLRYDCGKR